MCNRSSSSSSFVVVVIATFLFFQAVMSTSEQYCLFWQYYHCHHHHHHHWCHQISISEQIEQSYQCWGGEVLQYLRGTLNSQKNGEKKSDLVGEGKNCCANNWMKHTHWSPSGKWENNCKKNWQEWKCFKDRNRHKGSRNEMSERCLCQNVWPQLPLLSLVPFYFTKYFTPIGTT